MIGPIPMDDPFDTPFPMGPNAAAQWQERQRRQRTLRLLMMFLLMLLLMDGEEQKAVHRRSNDPNANLRRRKRFYTTTTTAGGTDGGLDGDTYRARVKEDAHVLYAAMKHPRWMELVKMNGGNDVEGQVRQWVREEMAREEKQLAAAAAAASSEKKKKKSDPEKRQDRASEKRDAIQKLANEIKDDEEAGRVVYHYPRNATGFYRGEWKRVDFADDVQGQNGEGSPQKNGGTETSVQASSDVKKPKEVELSSIEPFMEQYIKEKGETAGVFLLPPGLVLHSVTKNETTTATSSSKKEVADGPDLPSTQVNLPFSSSNGRSSLLRPASAGGVTPAEDTTMSSKPAALSLKHTSGRAALQLYARSVPGMKELSLLDGFVRLSDASSTGLPTRRDILLRVHGVVIHAIGRISLVSNARHSRNVLVLKSNEKEEDKKKKKREKALDSEDEDDDDDFDEVQEEEQRRKKRRRRLREALSSLVSSTTESTHHSVDDVLDKWKRRRLIEQIRDDAIALHTFEDVEEEIDVTHSDPERSDTDGGRWMLRTLDFDESLVDRHYRNPLDGSSNTLSKFLWRKDEQGGVRHQWSWLTSIFSPRRVLQGDKNELIAEPEVTDITKEDKYSEEKGEGSASESSSLNKSEKDAVKSNELGILKANKRDTSEIAEEKRRETRESNAVAKSHVAFTNNLFSYPYVPDGKDGSIATASTPVTRARLQSLEANAIRCEFELNFDMKEVHWTVGEWRKMLSRRDHEIQNIDPSRREVDENESTENESDDEDSVSEKKKVTHSIVTPAITFSTRDASFPDHSAKSLRDEAVAMAMTGSIVSHNCGFASTINVTAIRTDWEHTTGKAVNYTFCMLLVCLTQIIVLLRQLLHTQAQSAAARVSLICIGWQTVLDAMLCLAHILLCLLMQPLFTAFASVAFLKLLIFCVIEMKYMAIILQARNSSNGGQNTADEVRRQVTLLHMRFYMALFAAITIFWWTHERYLTIYVLLLYSFWVPQIIQNIITEAKRPLHTHFIYGMSFTRLVAPLYVFAVPNNFLKEADPEFPSNLLMCELLFLWVGLQAGILIAQGRYGARFMIPARFLPPKFDYSRPIPPSLLPQPTASSSNGESQLRNDRMGTDVEIRPLLGNDGTSGDRTTGVTRNRIKGNRSRATSDSNNATTTRTESPNNVAIAGTPTLDCVICYSPIDIHNRRGYMLAPCDHIFHRPCLVQWMEVKMECPICRTELPSL